MANKELQNIRDIQMTPTQGLRSGRIRSSSIPPDANRVSVFGDDDLSSIRPPPESRLTRDFTSDPYIVSPIGEGIGTSLVGANNTARKTSEDNFMDEKYVESEVNRFRAAVEWYNEVFPDNIRWSTAINDNFDRIESDYKSLVNKLTLIPTEGNPFKVKAIKELTSLRTQLINAKRRLWKERKESSFSCHNQSTHYRHTYH